MHDTQNYLDIEKIKAAAQAVINAATVSDGFNSVAKYMEAVSPVETLALIELLEKAMSDRNRFAANFKSMCDIWSDVDTYARTHAGKKIGESVAEFALKLLKEGNAAKAERDTARQQAATLRDALVNVMGGDDKEWLGRVRNEVASFVSIHGPNRRMGYAACPKFLADAVAVLQATHPENKA